ncbi:ROK family protein [Ancylomarina euxinus]|uniref:ROK family protein n=1 Tax=Ancylomarina euxinus TaxID=2283627 RepID=A0A425Y6N9_9BACT|nr:ROK family protein [Ancylomarina euxinus]MCZ4694039.1 ROK family protein [Ancylomarina euxinus]MUP14541.1 ROK family protein [Ancylomarina euxinus]RRG24091.1 ROK family protein [Ancylomarina euxinus]
MRPEFKYEKEVAGTANARKRKLEQYRKIVSHVYQNGKASIAEIVKYSKMSQPLVAALVDDLIGFGILLDDGIGESIGGRRPNLYCINPEYQYVIGVDINLHTLNIALFDLNNKLVCREEYKNCELENSPKYTDDLVIRVNQMLTKMNLTAGKILSMGVSIPGLVDAKNGISFTHLSFTKEGLSAYLSEKLGFSVVLDNDARMMALGEKAFGKAKGKKDVLCLNLSNGIGLGVILNGQLYCGKNGFAGEFGHILIDPDGDLCYCGKIGCLETLISGTILVKNIREAVDKGQPSLLSQYKEEGHNIDLRAVVSAIINGDQFAIDQLNKMSEYLGKGLVTLIHLLNPEMIILGGRLAHTGKYIVDPVNMVLNKYAMERISSETEVVCSDLLDDAALMGTLSNVMKEVLRIS